MGDVVEQFVRNSDQQIRMTLTEDGEPVSGAWTELVIQIGGFGSPRSVRLERSGNGDGITLDEVSGVLTISPGDLTDPEQDEIMTALVANRMYPVQIVVTSVLNDDNVVFGGKGSARIYFNVSDLPQ